MLCSRNLLGSYKSINSFKGCSFVNKLGARSSTHIIIKELTEKDGGKEEMAIFKIPESYRHKHISEETKTLLAGDWRKLSTETVKKIYDQHYSETYIQQENFENTYTRAYHVYFIVFMLFYMGMALKEPIYYFFFVTFMGFDEYLKLRDLDFHYAIECDAYARDEDIIYVRKRLHNFKVDKKVEKK